MKRIIALLLALVMVLALVACAPKAEAPADEPKDDVVEEPKDEPADEPYAPSSEETSSQPGEPADPNIPKTGDDTLVWPYILLFGIGLIGCILSATKKRRK